MDTAVLLSGLLFSSIGVGYLIYGKKQQHQAAFCCGLALLLYPYVIDQLWLIWLLGLALMAVPTVFKR